MAARATSEEPEEVPSSATKRGRLSIKRELKDVMSVLRTNKVGCALNVGISFCVGEDLQLDVFAVCKDIDSTALGGLWSALNSLGYEDKEVKALLAYCEGVKVCLSTV